jgi:hypothetical protein
MQNTAEKYQVNLLIAADMEPVMVTVYHNTGEKHRQGILRLAKGNYTLCLCKMVAMRNTIQFHTVFGQKIPTPFPASKDTMSGSFGTLAIVGTAVSTLRDTVLRFLYTKGLAKGQLLSIGVPERALLGYTHFSRVQMTLQDRYGNPTWSCDCSPYPPIFDQMRWTYSSPYACQ